MRQFTVVRNGYKVLVAPASRGASGKLALLKNDGRSTYHNSIVDYEDNTEHAMVTAWERMDKVIETYAKKGIGPRRVSEPKER